jgi:hypothetical protein
MDGSLRPVLKRQVIFVGASLGSGLLLTYFFGFLAGFAANIAIFAAAIFYIRYRQQKTLRTLGLGSRTAGRGYEQDGVRLRYACLSCGAEVKGDRCPCGSRMRKPLF